MKPTAPDGTEAYYPKKWTPVTIGLAGAMLVTVVLGVISFIPLRNLFLTYAGMAYLKVSRSGISYRYGKVVASFAWNDIQTFRPVQVNPKLSLVRITLGETVKPPETAKMPGFDNILLPDLYDWKPSELAGYLNSQKERYSNTAAAPREIYEK